MFSIGISFLALCLAVICAGDQSFSQSLRNGSCQEYVIPVSPSSIGLNYSVPPFENNFDVIDLVTHLASRDSANFSPFSGPLALSGNYTIAAEVCTPTSKTGKESVVLLLSHGLGYDRKSVARHPIQAQSNMSSYWDPSIAEQYNFVDHALSQGYSVFNYDRLGTGKSSRVGGYNEVQASQQVAILTQLAQNVRQGHYTNHIGIPSKLVLVGHSFGSFISNAAISSNNSSAPALADALVLTGFGYNLSVANFIEALNFKIASTTSNPRFSALDSGYLTWNDVFSNVATYFPAPYFEQAIANYTESEKQAVGISELLTFGTLDIHAPGFTGPVQILNGGGDFAVCGGNCTDWVEPYAPSYFPNAKVLEVVEHGGVGHAVNLHENATGAFGVMTDGHAYTAYGDITKSMPPPQFGNVP